MVDFNDEKYLSKLRSAAKSSQGRIILEYLLYEMKRFDYQNIETENKSIEEIGRTFKAFQEINDYLKTVLSVMDETLK